MFKVKAMDSFRVETPDRASQSAAESYARRHDTAIFPVIRHGGGTRQTVRAPATQSTRKVLTREREKHRLVRKTKIPAISCNELSSDRSPLSRRKRSGVLRITVILTLFLLLWQSSAHSSIQPADTLFLSLEDALQITMKRNLDILTAVEQVRSSRAGYNESKTAFLPSLGVSTSISEQFDDYETMTNDTNSQASVSASWTLWDGGSRFADLDMSHASLILSEAEERLWREQALRTTMDSYLSLIESYHSLNVATESLELARETLEQTEGLRRAGKATTSDILRAKVEVSSQQKELISASQEVHNLQRDLCDVLNMPYSIIVPFEPELQFPDLHQFTDIQPDEIETPSITKARANLDRAIASTDATEASFLPRLSASGSANWSGSDFSFTDPDYRAGLSLSWSLFEGGSRHFRLEQSHAEKRTATYQLNAAEQETWNSFQRGIGNIKSSLAQWETAKQTVELATESYRQLQELYTLGRATSLELFDAQDTLNDAKLDEITARYAIHTSYISLLSELGLLEEYVSKGYIIATNSEDSSKGER